MLSYHALSLYCVCCMIVWNRQQIIELFELATRTNLFKECLPYAAYTYSNGPFSHLWLRFGYDPTHDSHAWIYQHLHCKLQTNFVKNITVRLVNHIGKEKLHKRTIDLDHMILTGGPVEFSHSFIDKGFQARVPISVLSSLIKYQVNYQVHTMRYDSIYQFITSHMKLSKVCHPLTGWFTCQSIEAFRGFILQFIEQRAQDMIGLTEIPVEMDKDHEGNIDLEMRLQLVREVLAEKNDAQDYTSSSSGQGRGTSSMVTEEKKGGAVSRNVMDILMWLKKYQHLTSKTHVLRTTAHRLLLPTVPLHSRRPPSASAHSLQTSSQAQSVVPAQVEPSAFDIFQTSDTSDSEM
jgi:hypothetical protein